MMFWRATSTLGGSSTSKATSRALRRLTPPWTSAGRSRRLCGLGRCDHEANAQDAQYKGDPPMTTWTSDELTKIGSAEELRIASLRRDGTQTNPVTIWVVRLGKDVYVR